MVGFVGGGARRLMRISLVSRSMRGDAAARRARAGRKQCGAPAEAVPWEIRDVSQGESERGWTLSRRTARFLLRVT